MAGGLKAKLIRWLGGYTIQEPMNFTAVQRNVRTLKVKRILRQDMAPAYPEYLEHVRKDMAYSLADRMIEEKLIHFRSEEEQGRIVVTAVAMVAEVSQ